MFFILPFSAVEKGAYSGKKKAIIKIPLPKSTTKGKNCALYYGEMKRTKQLFSPVYLGEECATLATTEKGKV